MARSPTIGYALAFGVLAAAVLLRWLLDPVMGDTLPLVTLFGAVAYAVWVSGYRAAIVASIFGYVACAYLFIEPRGQLGSTDLEQRRGARGVPIHVLAHHRLRRGDAARAGARGRAARNAARHVAQHRRRRHHDRHRGPRHLYQRGGRVLDGLDASGRAGSAARHRVPHRQRDHPSSRSRIPRRGRYGKASSSAWRITRVLIRQDGTECPIDDSAAPIRDERGQVSGCVLIFRDVTAQRRMERERASQLLDCSPARVDRRIVGRRHHQQVARRRDSKLERGRRTALWLLRGGGRGPPHLARHPARAHRGGRTRSSRA